MVLSLEDKVWLKKNFKCNCADGLMSKSAKFDASKVLKGISELSKKILDVPKRVVVESSKVLKHAVNTMSKALHTFTVNMYRRFEQLKGAVLHGINAIKTNISTLFQNMKKGIQGFLQKLSPIYWIKRITSTVKEALLDNPIMRGLRNTVNAFKKGFSTLLNIPKNIVNGLFSGIGNLFGGPKQNNVYTDKVDYYNTLGSTKNYVLAKDARFNGGKNTIYLNVANDYQDRLQEKRTQKYQFLVAEMLTSIDKTLKKIYEHVRSDGLLDSIKGIFSGITGTITNIVDGVVKQATGWFNSLFPAITSILNMVKWIPRIAGFIGLGVAGATAVGGASLLATEAYTRANDAGRNSGLNQASLADSRWREANALRDTSSWTRLNNTDYINKLKNTKLTGATKNWSIGSIKDSSISRYNSMDLKALGDKNSLSSLNIETGNNTLVLAPFAGTVRDLKYYTENDYFDTERQTNGTSRDSSNLQVYYQLRLEHKTNKSGPFTKKESIIIRGFIQPNVSNNQDIPMGYPIGIATSKFEIIADMSSFNSSNYAEMYKQAEADNFSGAISQVQSWRDVEALNNQISKDISFREADAKDAEKLYQRTSGEEYIPPEGVLTDSGIMVTTSKSNKQAEQHVNIIDALKNVNKANPNAGTNFANGVSTSNNISVSDVNKESNQTINVVDDNSAKHADINALK